VSEQPLYPLLLEPTLYTKVWGGRKLQDVMGKTLPTDAPYGESWELHDTSRVANGRLAGKQIRELLNDYGAELAGAHNDLSEGFPLLVKILDAAQWLSVQVHPNDKQAAELEGEPRGKTEAWYILGADADSKLIIGVKPGTDEATMAQAIRETQLEDLLVSETVSAGDLLYIPAGTIHALGPGLLIYEIQQSSDTTYRLYDWGRVGLEGKPRDLHIEKGVRVSNLDSLPEITHPAKDTTGDVMAVEGDYFKTMLHRLDDTHPEAVLDTEGQFFHALTCIAGAVVIDVVSDEDAAALTLEMGQSALIPASLGAYTLRGTGQVLRSWQNLPA